MRATFGSVGSSGSRSASTGRCWSSPGSSASGSRAGSPIVGALGGRRSRPSSCSSRSLARPRARPLGRRPPQRHAGAGHHALAARRRRPARWPMPSAGAEFRIAAAGPAMSYRARRRVLRALCRRRRGESACPALVVSRRSGGWRSSTSCSGSSTSIPAAPLDGGRILAGAVWAVTGDRTAVRDRGDPGRSGVRWAADRGGHRRSDRRRSVRLDLDRVHGSVRLSRGDGGTAARAAARGPSASSGVRDVMSRGARDGARLDDGRGVRRRARRHATAPPRAPGRGVGRTDRRRGHPRAAGRVPPAERGSRAGVRTSHADVDGGDRRARTRASWPRRERSDGGPVPVVLVVADGALAGIVTPADLRRACGPRAVAARRRAGAGRLTISRRDLGVARSVSRLRVALRERVALVVVLLALGQPELDLGRGRP